MGEHIHQSPSTSSFSSHGQESAYRCFFWVLCKKIRENRHDPIHRPTRPLNLPCLSCWMARLNAWNIGTHDLPHCLIKAWKTLGFDEGHAKHCIMGIDNYIVPISMVLSVVSLAGWSCRACRASATFVPPSCWTSDSLFWITIIGGLLYIFTYVGLKCYEPSLLLPWLTSLKTNLFLPAVTDVLLWNETQFVMKIL